MRRDCDQCGSHREVAYTLTTYPETGGGDRIDLHFCSSDCLRVWTGSPRTMTARRRTAETGAGRVGPQ